jgi:hypothetical protein
MKLAVELYMEMGLKRIDLPAGLSGEAGYGQNTGSSPRPWPNGLLARNEYDQNYEGILLRALSR